MEDRSRDLSPPALPRAVCLRVTRACNARCGFCLAPPDGSHLPLSSIERRLRWLAALGVRKVNLSGGEPTIRNDLSAIIECVRHHGLASAMTTNGIRLPSGLIDALVQADTKVKVSMHGPPLVHDEMLGRRCHDDVDRHVTQLLAGGVQTAVQGVVTRRAPQVDEWLVDYCLDRGISKLRLVPFVPRGRGRETDAHYGLSFDQRDDLRARVARLREDLRPVLDVRLLDFWSEEYYVLETDGRLQIQRETDASDTTIAYAC